MESTNLANIGATLIAALLTGLVAFFTARLTARVQQSAAEQNAHKDENERAWTRADKSDGDAEKWRTFWAQEFERRCKLEAEIVVLKGHLEALEGPQPQPQPHPQPQ